MCSRVIAMRYARHSPHEILKTVLIYFPGTPVCVQPSPLLSSRRRKDTLPKIQIDKNQFNSIIYEIGFRLLVNLGVNLENDFITGR